MPRFIQHALAHGPLGSLPARGSNPPILPIGFGLLALCAVAAVALFSPQALLAPAPAAAIPVTVLETQVPAAPVESLDRTDLGATVANTGDSRLENLTVEMSVVAPDGTVAMRSRQSGLGLDGHDTRAIMWGWRVPAQLPSGQYTARVVVTSKDGSRLASSEGSPATFTVVSRNLGKTS